ncbi:hypothetical protein QUA71_28080 [Microcoleus sp. MON1_C5]|uniref:hypothetical protein n=1 Tax=Microcoleus sp. MON1_C5 TaxID=2818828 RepID=UPI002FD2AEB4
MNNSESNKVYRETYQKWMEKQTEINKLEAQLNKLQREASELWQQVEKHKREKLNG